LTDWRDLYGEAVDRLGDHQGARWLVEEASGGQWPAVLGEPVASRAAGFFYAMLHRREKGEPLQYVLGHWAFRRLDLMVDRRVLIPRPETEVVVEVALAELSLLGAREPVVLDLGTGSGAIGLSVLSEHRTARLWATDSSEDALAVASANLAALGVVAAARAHLCHGSWWDALPSCLEGRADLVVTNPPYVALGEMEVLPEEVSCWEPHQALCAGPTGLEAIEAVLAGAPRWLAPRSALVSEIAPHQAGPAGGLARAAGFSEVEVRSDLAGRERVLVARRL
jgi:release factor glutamine methyltransferase